MEWPGLLRAAPSHDYGMGPVIRDDGALAYQTQGLPGDEVVMTNETRSPQQQYWCSLGRRRALPLLLACCCSARPVPSAREQSRVRDAYRDTGEAHPRATATATGARGEGVRDAAASSTWDAPRRHTGARDGPGFFQIWRPRSPPPPPPPDGPGWLAGPRRRRAGRERR